MGIETRHFREEIQELLDNRLNLEARLEVEKHLQSCEECRRELEALRWIKQFSHQQYAAEAAPAQLEENILAALNLEDRSSVRRTVFPWSWGLQPRAILAYGFLLCVAIALALSYFILREPLRKSPELVSQPELPAKPPELPVKSDLSSPPKPSPQPEPSPPSLPAKPKLSPKLKSTAKPKQSAKPKLPAKPELLTKLELPAAVAQDYRRYKAGKLPLLLQTEDVRETEKFFSEEGITFQTRVFDLGMMNYRLVGGRVHQLINRRSALFVYRGEGNKILVCQMYPGHVTELLPAGVVRRENKGIEFYIYRINGLTVVFWQEGAVTCVLSSDINPEEVVQLAFAKAVKI